ncbi:MAG: hypothetical protein AAGK09_04570 [Planctomycetota bacterium]
MTPGPPRATRFVILTMARTGSYMLSSALNSHPQVACFGELLKRNPLNEIDVLDFPQRRPDAAEWIERRHERPIEFVDTVLDAADTEASCVGFKLMIPQSPAMLDRVCEGGAFRVVLLTRENALASYASGRIARATGQGVVMRGDEVIAAKTTFDADDFERFRRRRAAFFDDVRDRLGPDGALDIEYREACTPDGMARVVAYIGADASVAIAAGTERRNSGSIADRFDNPDAAREYLEKIDRSAWLTEG